MCVKLTRKKLRIHTYGPATLNIANIFNTGSSIDRMQRLCVHQTSLTLRNALRACVRAEASPSNSTSSASVQGQLASASLQEKQHQSHPIKDRQQATEQKGEHQLACHTMACVRASSDTRHSVVHASPAAQGHARAWASHSMACNTLAITVDSLTTLRRW